MEDAMRAKGLLLIGAVAGLVFAATPQGRRAIENAKVKLEGVWASPDVQRTVANVEGQVRKVPGVGDNIADAIKGAGSR
jgi:hypothetical protein